MSIENKDNSVIEDSQDSNPNPENESAKEEFVPKKAYLEVTQDMHKYKNERQELRAKVAEYEAKFEAEKKADLEKNEKWKELSEAYKTELQTLKSQISEKDQKFVKVHKSNAVIEALGGLRKPDYVKFLDLESVEMDEKGNINPESVVKVAEKFKQDYPELLKAQDNPKLPNKAPSFKTGKKSIDEMGKDELVSLFSKAK